MKITPTIKAILIVSLLLIMLISYLVNSSIKGDQSIDDKKSSNGQGSVDEYNQRKRDEVERKNEKAKRELERKSSNIDRNDSDVFLKKYSGSYTIEIKGYNSADDAEALALSPSGQCTWIWLAVKSNGTTETQKKYGHWSATEGFIHIVINGNTGELTEDYKLENGVFRNGDRYLKETKN